MDIYKKIFGKTYHFNFDDKDFSTVLGSVGLYPDAGNNVADVSINILDRIGEDDCISKNPAIFLKCRDGIITKFASCTVKWKKREALKPLEIDLHIPKGPKGRKALVAKFFSMEFSTDVEAFEQILHELVLVPSVYFFDDLSIVHAAALALGDRAVLVAGTGGTGKTSALLALRNNDDISFITDDIAIISRDGKVFPNLAWPKVYGYNLSSYITKSELLKGRGRWDRFQFNYRLRKNPEGVRRKVRPDKLYKGFKNDGIPIDKIVYLFRDDHPEMRLNSLRQEQAIKMGIDVMKTEYSIFHNHLIWDAYNSTPLGESPILELERVFENWETNLNYAFKDKDIQILHIPKRIVHEVYLDFMRSFITNG